MEYITLLQENWLAYATAFVTIFSAVAALTPTPTVGSTWSTIYKFVDMLALNIGKAKDKGDK